METVIFIMIMLFAVLMMIISAFHRDKSQPERYSKTTVALTTHARERMAERYGITNEDKMYSFALEAFMYGKSYNQLSGYLSRKLRNIETQDEDPRIARFYQNSIFVFSTDGVLITLFPYEPQFYH